ncbi:MAG: translocation/assembly module TamB domain-containing protein [bacterium]|nr:MAG: translocation/assembly module TamB domain-containing protein [bacterium]
MSRTGDEPSVVGNFRLNGNLEPLIQVIQDILPGRLLPITGNIDLAMKIDGAMKQPQVECSLLIPELEIAGIYSHDTEMHARIAPDSIQIDSFGMNVLGGRISCTALIVADSISDSGVRMTFDRVDLQRLLTLAHHETLPYQGKINGSLVAEGPIKDPIDWYVSSSIYLQDLRYRAARLPDIRIDAALNGGKVDVSLQQDTAELSAHGKLAGKRISGRFSADVKRIESLIALYNIPGLSGELKLEGVVEGDVESPVIQADVSGRNVKYRQFPVDTFSCGVLYRKGRLEVPKLYAMGLQDPIDTLHSPFNLPSLSGGFLYEARLRDYPDNMQGNVVINLNHLRYRLMEFDLGRMHLSLAPRRVDLDSLILKRDSLIVKGAATYDISTRSGSCTIELTLETEVDTGSGDTPTDTISETVSLDHDYRRQAAVRASFLVSEDNGYSVSMEGDRVGLEMIDVLFGRKLDIGGALDFRLDAGGQFSEPRADLTFTLDRPRFREFRIDSLIGTAGMARGRLELRRFDLHRDVHRVSARASLDLVKSEKDRLMLSPHSAFEGRLHADEIDLGVLSRITPSSIKASGLCAVDLAWDGTISSPHPSGTLTIRGGSIQIREQTPEVQNLNLSASVSDSILTIRSLNGYIKRIPFLMSGELMLSTSRAVEARFNLSLSDHGIIEGKGFISKDSLRFDTGIDHLDLSLFHPFVPSMKHLSGNLNAAVSIMGTTSDPEINGDLSCKGLAFQPTWLEAPFTNGIVDLSFNRDRIRIDSLSVRLDNGSLYASGELVHDKSEPVTMNLKLGATNLNFNRPRRFKAHIRSAALTYRTGDNYHDLDGDVMLGETRFLANFKPQSILPFTRSLERPPQELPDFLQKTRLNIRIRESDEVWIDNNLARLRLQPSLNIIGFPARPNAAGRVTVLKGYVLFLDRKLQITRGVADFTDPDRLNPIIDLVAKTTVKSYRAMEVTPYEITLTIRGSMAEAVVGLISEPPLERPDIISLLTIGVTRSQLAGREDEKDPTTMRDVLLERAQQLSSQRVAGYISRNVGGLLGLDQVTIEGNLFRFDETWGPDLLASKKLSSRAEVTYRTNIGHLNERSIRLDYRLTKRLSLQGETDQFGRSGLDLKYGLRFK